MPTIKQEFRAEVGKLFSFRTELKKLILIEDHTSIYNMNLCLKLTQDQKNRSYFVTPS